MQDLTGGSEFVHMNMILINLSFQSENVEERKDEPRYVIILRYYSIRKVHRTFVLPTGFKSSGYSQFANRNMI